MKVLPTTLTRRFRNRPDSEHGQALVRLVIALLIVSYLEWLQQAVQETSPMLWVMLAESCVGIALLAGIALQPGVSHLRRWIGMLADYATLTCLMILSPRELAPLYVIILWVTMGNGLRFGGRYLGFASALAATAFSTVVWQAEYWHAQPYLAGGLLLGLVAIPLYMSSLLRALSAAIDEARRANAAKSRFLATMSHEFRSPLNGIIGMSELLHGTRMGAEQREYADVIQASAQTLLLLVDDVLDISAIEAGKLQRRDGDFNLHDLVARIEKMLQQPAAEKGLLLRTRIDDDVPVRLHGDGAHLTQILLNLMHNAVKFTEKGSVNLHVRLASMPGAALRLCFSVRDTGIGIPAEDKERIFRAFEQVDSGPTRRFGGTGLGTTIAKTLTQLLEGNIGVEDNPGGGSHFWIEVPLRAQGVHQGQSEADASGKVVAFDDPFVRHKARVRPLRVLVADDQPANRTVLTRILERAGHKVQQASDGEEALDQLELDNIDLAIVDMHMPRLSGLDVLRQLRYMQAGGKRTPVIVLSADATAQAARDAEEAGAPAFLTKPVMVARLLETIADLITPARLPAVRPVSDIARPSINPAVLEELAGMQLGDTFLSEFVEQCIKDAGECLAELRRHSSARDWSEVRETAHALKGIAENLGAQLVAERCQQLMRASDEALAKELPRLQAELTAQMLVVAEQSRLAVTQLGKGGGGTSEAPGSKATPGPDSAG
jgi:two-component system sensor histidine kinase RpfC